MRQKTKRLGLCLLLVLTLLLGGCQTSAVKQEQASTETTAADTTEQKQETEDYQVGDLFVSPQRHVVRVAGEEVPLTNKEFELLCLLLEHQGMAMTRDAIMDGVWGQEFSRENRTLDVHVRTLRTKLGAAGHYIETVRGVGYKIGGAS